MENNKIKVVQWNANGIKDRIIEFYYFLTTNNIHIACICETFLKDNIQLHTHPNYRIERLDRNDRPRGGVAIIIKNSINYELLPHINTTIFESTGIEIKTSNNTKIKIISTYLPGGTSNQLINQHFANDISKLTQWNNSYFVFGDFNAKHRLWNCSRANRAGTILYNELCNHNFIISNPPTPTHVPSDINKVASTIDIIITNGLHDHDIPFCEPLSSDHNAVITQINLRDSLSNKPKFLKPSFKDAKWDKYRGIIHFNINEAEFNIENINTTSEIDVCIEKFEKLLNHASDRSIPMRANNKYSINLTPEIKFMIGERNRINRIWQRYRDNATKTFVNKLTNKIKKKINILRNANWNKKLSELEPANQSLWQVSKFLKNRNRFIPPLKRDDDSIALTSDEKANLIAEQFAVNHQNPLANNNPIFEKEVNDTVENFLSTTINQNEIVYPDLQKVQDFVKNMKNSKAPGIDKIHNRLLKNLPERGIKNIHFIICLCLKMSYFPEKWKNAKVVAIHKPGKDPTKSSSYRPISLLSSISKLLEKAYLYQINRHLDNNNILPDEQYGFRAFRSTTHQLTKSTIQIKMKLTQKSSTGMILLDVEKAFDRVWHLGLIYKLIQIKLQPNIIKIIHSFLMNRKFFVEINGRKSANHSIPFGVPQGAASSPILYNIYTHDIPHHRKAKLGIFADDTSISVSSPSLATIQNNLTDAASNIQSYFTKWKIKLNEQKTQAIFYTRRRKNEIPQQPLNIFNSNIEWETNVKYLGMYLDKTLTYRNHIEYIIEKVHKVTKILYPMLNRKSSLDIKNKLLLYKVVLRPIATYACPTLNVFWLTSTDLIYEETGIQ